MNNNEVSKKLKEILNGVDFSLTDKNIENILKSAKKQNLTENLSQADKEKILNLFMNMDTNEIKDKLKNVQTKDFSAEDLFKKMR